MIKNMVDLNRKKKICEHTYKRASGGNLKGLAGLGK
jgi:hypothetical protein